MPKPNEPSPGDVAAPAGQTNAIKIQHIMRYSIVLYIYTEYYVRYIDLNMVYKITIRTYINKWCSTV